MIWLIVPIGFVGAWIWFSISNRDIFGGLLTGFVTALITAILCFGTCIVAKYTFNIEYKVIESHKISALVDNDSVSNSTFLIQTHADSTLKYGYMYYEEGCGYTFNEINAKLCHINYTDDTPRVDVCHPYFTNSFIKYLFGNPIFTIYDYVFYLPQDTEVIDDFIIDFE